MLDGGASLSTGAVVHANVLARLLGVRILRLEADVVLAPALTARPIETRALASVPVEGSAHRSGGQLSDARRLLAAAEDLLGV